MESTINTLKVGEKMTKPKQSLAMKWKWKWKFLVLCLCFMLWG